MKNLSKRGFSLLEVMLAVAIMAIASSMIMYGFVSSMSYANNSSIYARSAAYNARGNYYYITSLAHNTGRGGPTGRYTVLQTDSVYYGGGAKHQIAIDGGTLHVNVDVRNFRMDSNGPGGAVNTATFNIGSAVVADSAEGTGDYASATVVDNRTSFFYTVPDVNFPSGYSCPDGKCPKCGAPYEMIMMRRGGESLETGHFHYVCPNYDQPDHTAYYADLLAEW